MSFQRPSTLLPTKPAARFTESSCLQISSESETNAATTNSGPLSSPIRSAWSLTQRPVVLCSTCAQCRCVRRTVSCLCHVVFSLHVLHSALFFTGQRTAETRLPLEESQISASFACNRPTRFTLHLGPFRDFAFDILVSINYDACFYDIPIFITALCFASLSFVLHSVSMSTVLRFSLWKERKYLQLLLLNFSSIVSVLCFGFFISYRYLFDLEQLLCVLGFQVFCFGLSWNNFSLISLSIDCVVAVFFPLKFRSLMTTKQFFLLNGGAFLFLVAVILLPVPVFGSMNDGYMTLWCELKRVLPEFYVLFVFAMSALGGILLILLNVGIGTGVVQALIQREKLTQQNDVKSKMLKLVFRLLSIICVNILFSLPLTLLLVGVRILSSDSVSIAIAMGNSIVNILIFGFSDEQFRKHVLAFFRR